MEIVELFNKAEKSAGGQMTWKTMEFSSEILRGFKIINPIAKINLIPPGSFGQTACGLRSLIAEKYYKLLLSIVLEFGSVSLTCQTLPGPPTPS